MGGKVKDILFWIRPPSLNFYICHFTLTNFRENKLSPWKFCKDLWHPIEFRMSKAKAHGNSTLIPQEFWNDFPSISHPGSFMSSTPPPPLPPPFLFVCFSGIAQYNLIAVEAFIPVSAVAFHDFKNVWKRYHVSWEGYIWYIFAILLLRLKRSTVEVRENGFYFISKAFLVFEILKF